MNTVYIGIGSNIEREHHVLVAIEKLKNIDSSLRYSTVFEAEPVGFCGSSFFNLAVELTTSLSLSQLSSKLKTIELELGRRVDAKKNEDRTIDLDILLFGEETSSSPKIPRDDIYKFAFALWPLFELCPQRVIPGDGRTVAELWHSFEHDQVLKAVNLQHIKGSNELL
ncbi:MAG: 2-amino-4-hydroxy-6-hydroxymethyldihydropteridine diphosphokinase [Aliivibrio sp.]|uniref:2-amino-4-hydroxy-6- hydroxymethyldihydropteridine diphosphokinase n=1 Tax=Aliivibrio sp. TaxID=1872443 RepID=UPI001A5EB03A|nr:2-amino-4-hydroxy-6-hydroxymethyldihydropteridine diphosphokinase [Aliivibrio sp.]